MLVISLILTLFQAFPVEESVLFSSSRAGNSDIYLMNADGSEVEQLTSSEAEEWAPVWLSKNEISFLRQDEEGISIFKLNLETKEEMKLNHPPNCTLDDKNFIPSPTNPSLWLYSCNQNIYLFNQDNSDLIEATKSLNGSSLYPSWAKDGNSILFTNNSSGSNNIYQYSLEQKRISPVVKSAANDERAELSPDGKFLIFSSNQLSPSNQNILLLNLESKHLQNISNSKGNALVARWAADMKSIYFGSNQAGNWEIYRYDLSQKKSFRLTENDSFDGDPQPFPFPKD